MDETGTFWVRIWTLCAALVATLAVSGLVYSGVRNAQIRDMVVAGASPIAAYCAAKADPGYVGDALICAQTLRKGD